MGSESLARWDSERATALDRIEEAHTALGGAAKGRRYKLEHINHVYLMSLCGQFQGFARDLLEEALDALVERMVPIRVTAQSFVLRCSVGLRWPGATQRCRP